MCAYWTSMEIDRNIIRLSEIMKIREYRDNHGNLFLIKRCNDITLSIGCFLKIQFASSLKL